jgi:hypothetical protein
MALVGVISAETDQAVFPFGKANPIAATILAQFQPAWQPEFHTNRSFLGFLALGGAMSEPRYRPGRTSFPRQAFLDSPAAASIMPPHLKRRVHLEIRNSRLATNQCEQRKSFPDFQSC